MGRKLLEIKCYHCQKTFKFKKGLEDHLKDAHHLGTANAKAKKTWCQICGTSYSTEAELVDHKDSHVMSLHQLCSIKPKTKKLIHNLMPLHIMQEELLLQRSQLRKTPAVSEFSGCKNVRNT